MKVNHLKPTGSRLRSSLQAATVALLFSVSAQAQEGSDNRDSGSPSEAQDDTGSPPAPLDESSSLAESPAGVEGEDNRAPEKGESKENDGARAGDRVVAPIALHTPVQALDVGPRRVEVILELVIDATGRVISANALNESGELADAAVASAKDWTFKPATQGGKPVAAKISFLVTYEPTPAPLEEDQPPEGGVAPAAAPAPVATAAAAPMTEVYVIAEVPDPGARGFTREETRNIAGAFNDPLRALEVLPGVTPVLNGLPLFFIRGAPSGNVGYFIDGIEVPQLYHAFLGPSVLNPAFLEGVQLHAGPMPARFGRYAGAAVEAELASPQGRLRGEVDLRLLDAGGFIEAPFDDGRGYAMVGGRYSYTALLASLFSPGQRFDYWDYQALAGYRVTPDDEISLFTLGAYDYLGNDEGVTSGTEFHRIDARYSHDFSDQARARLAATYGFDRTRTDAGFLKDHNVTTRLDYDYQTGDLVVHAGGNVKVADYDMDIDPAISEPEIYLELFPPRTDVEGGVFVEFVLFPGKRVQLIPGLRTDIYSSLGDVAVGVDPRLAVTYQLTPWLSSAHAIGVAHQSPNFVPNIPGAKVGGLEGGLQETVQASTEYTFALPLQTELTLGGFINGTQNLSDPIGLNQTLAIDETSTEQRAFGRSAGLEVFLRRHLTRRFAYLLSYTFSKTLRSFDTITTVPGYERPHVLNVASTVDMGKHWRASSKFALASGIPARETTLDGFVYREDDRSRPLVRLDLKLSKRWYVSERFYWGLYAEVLNATFSPTVARRTCTVDGCEDAGSAPIFLPNLGAELHWD